jgi:hypothetical protein
VITAYELKGKSLLAYRRRRRKIAMNKRSKLPDGWDEAGVKRVLEHYEGQSEEQAVAEDEAASEQRDQTLMEVPMNWCRPSANSSRSVEKLHSCGAAGA